MSTIDTILGAYHRVTGPHRINQPFSSEPVWKRLWRRYMKYRDMCRSREALLRLTNEQLRDIGITREQAVAEADKNSIWI